MTKVQQLRQYYGVTQYEFADKCRLSLSSIQSVEKGNRVRVYTAKMIAEGLGMNISELFITSTNPKYLHPISTFEIGEQV